MRVFAGIGCFARFTSPEVVHLALLLLPDIERRPFAAIGGKAAIVFGEIISDALIEFEVPPSPLAREGKLPRDRGATDDRQGYALFQIHYRL